MSDKFGISFSHGDHYDYQVENLKDGEQRGVSHDNHLDFEVNKSLKSGGEQKQKRRKHKGLTRRKNVRKRKGKKHRGEKRKKEKVNYTLVLNNVSGSPLQTLDRQYRRVSNS